MLELWDATKRIAYLPAASETVRVTESLNDQYFCSFTYPKIKGDEYKYDNITRGREIRFPNHVENGQRFIIRSVNEVRDGEKTYKSVDSMHVALTLGRYYYDGYIDFQAAVYPDEILSLLAEDTPFTFIVEGNFEPQDIWEWGEDSKLALLHKLVDLWKAELSFNNYEITFTKRKGVDSGKQIRRRKNMKGIKCTIDDSERVTRLYGYGKNGLTIEGYAGHTVKYIDSQYFDPNEPFMAKKEWADIEDQGKLLQEMQKYLAEYELPKVSYEVETLRLGEINVGDTVRIIDDALGYKVDGRLLEYDRYPFNKSQRPRLVLGNFRPLKTADYIFQATVSSKKAISYTSRNAVLKGIKYDDSITLVDGLGMRVSDNLDREMVRLGQTGPGEYGLAMFNKSGTKTIWQEAETGDANFAGKITASQIIGSYIAGTEINGGTITGALIRTNDGYPRSEMSVTDRLFAVYKDAFHSLAIVNLTVQNVPGVRFWDQQLNKTAYIYYDSETPELFVIAQGNVNIGATSGDVIIGGDSVMINGVNVNSTLNSLQFQIYSLDARVTALESAGS